MHLRRFQITSVKRMKMKECKREMKLCRKYVSCFTSKLHVLISETLAARGSIWKFE
jgi:hypothetical protein